MTLSRACVRGGPLLKMVIPAVQECGFNLPTAHLLDSHCNALPWMDRIHKLEAPVAGSGDAEGIVLGVRRLDRVA
ncbi:MAG: hypothetical protein V3V08_10140 [Nannocystaceae bacterium]